MIDDPAYDEPLVRSWNPVLDLGQQLESVPGQIVDKIAGLLPGRVPPSSAGDNPFLQEFASKWAYPLTVGRPANDIPQYQTKLRPCWTRCRSAP